MRLIISRSTNSRRQGQSLVELGAGLIIIIPVVLVCIDLATLYMGVNLNDTVCRDAARAASVGPPNGINLTAAQYPPNGIALGEATRRVQGVISRANATTGAVQLDPSSVLVNENIVSLPTVPFGGPVNGQVTVTTSVKVWPPFLLSLMSQGQPQVFTTNKTFKYTWAMQSTTTLVPPSSAGTTF